MVEPRSLTLKQLFSTSVLVFCLFLLATFISAWSGPPYQGTCGDPPCPPGGNVPAPINVGPAGQIKQGGLVLNASGGATNGLIVHAGKVRIGKDNPQHALDILGNIWVTGQIAIQDGSQGVGKVLASDANGIASWQSPSGTITGGNCPAGQVVTGINSNGTPRCSSPPTSGLTACRICEFDYVDQWKCGGYSSGNVSQPINLIDGAPGQYSEFASRLAIQCY